MEVQASSFAEASVNVFVIWLVLACSAVDTNSDRPEPVQLLELCLQIDFSECQFGMQSTAVAAAISKLPPLETLDPDYKGNVAVFGRTSGAPVQSPWLFTSESELCSSRCFNTHSESEPQLSSRLIFQTA